MTLTVADLERTLRIEGRLNGPPDHANGGFACGTFAGLVDTTAAVRLHRMVPLEKNHRATPTGTGRWRVFDGDGTIAEVSVLEPFCDAPPVRPDLETARRAREAHVYRGVRHLLSDCVVCGPERIDGLEVTPGPLTDVEEVLATPFVVKPDFSVGGLASTASLWGALDCVSYPAGLMARNRLGLLGELAVDVRRVPAVAEELVALGWTTGSGSRSHRTCSALIDQGGHVIAAGRAVWVELA